MEDLERQALTYKLLYNGGHCTREKAESMIQPYLDSVNLKASEIAKKYNQKPRKVSFISFVR